MSKGGDAPAAPDPKKTAQAQTATNKETALWNAALNNVNQITPYGNLTYTQSGGGKTYDDAKYNAAMSTYNQQVASGNKGAKKPKLNSYLISDLPPQYTSKIDLSPEQQKLLDTQNRSNNAIASLGEQQIGRIGQAVSTPYSYEGLPDSFSQDDYNAASLRGEQAINSRLDPQFARDEESLRTRLLNQGIGQGSQAYNTEFERFNQAKNDARTQAILQGGNYGSQLQNDSLQRRNQGIQEYNAQRNAPLNEYTALTSGQQVQNPSFQSGNYQGAQNTDYAGLVNQGYQNQLGQYNAQTAQGNGVMNGLFGLGSSFLGSQAGSAAAAALFSDERLKENIVPMGEENGHKIYRFNYKNNPGQSFIGVIAQEVQETDPDAVYEIDGYLAVNYDRLGIKMREADNG